MDGAMYHRTRRAMRLRAGSLQTRCAEFLIDNLPDLIASASDEDVDEDEVKRQDDSEGNSATVFRYLPTHIKRALFNILRKITIQYQSIVFKIHLHRRPLPCPVLTDQLLYELFDNNCLDVAACNTVTDKGIFMLAGLDENGDWSGSENKLRGVKHVDIRDCEEISERGIAALFRACEDIESIRVGCMNGLVRSCCDKFMEKVVPLIAPENLVDYRASSDWENTATAIAMDISERNHSSDFNLIPAPKLRYILWAGASRTMKMRIEEHCPRIRVLNNRNYDENGDLIWESVDVSTTNIPQHCLNKRVELDDDSLAVFTATKIQNWIRTHTKSIDEHYLEYVRLRKTKSRQKGEMFMSIHEPTKQGNKHVSEKMVANLEAQISDDLEISCRQKMSESRDGMRHTSECKAEHENTDTASMSIASGAGTHTTETVNNIDYKKWCRKQEKNKRQWERRMQTEYEETTLSSRHASKSPTVSYHTNWTDRVHNECTTPKKVHGSRKKMLTWQL